MEEPAAKKAKTDTLWVLCKGVEQPARISAVGAEDVYEFKKKLMLEFRHALKDVDAAALMIYKSKAMFDGKDDPMHKDKPEYQALNARTKLSDLSLNDEDELYVHYDEPAASSSLDDDLAQVRRELEQLRLTVDDPQRHAVSAKSGGGSEDLPSWLKVQVRKAYHYKCAFCGRTSMEDGFVLSVAHAAVDASKFAVSAGKGKTFSEAVSLMSTRNYILLCGGLGVVGSCHNAWDEFSLGLLPSQMGSDWRLINFDEKWCKAKETLDGFLKPAFDFQRETVYYRVLAARLRRVITNHQCRNTDLLTFCGVFADLSAEASEEEGADTPKGKRKGKGFTGKGKYKKSVAAARWVPKS